MISAFAPFKLFSIAKIELPSFVIFVISFLFLDFLTYSIHRVSHKITWLWRLPCDPSLRRACDRTVGRIASSD